MDGRGARLWRRGGAEPRERAALWGLAAAARWSDPTSRSSSGAGGDAAPAIRLHRAVAARLRLVPPHPSHGDASRDAGSSTSTTCAVRSRQALAAGRAAGGARGIRLGPHVAGDRTRSDLERDFLALCRRHGLPRARGQRPRRALDGRLPLARSSGSRSRPTATSYHRGSVAFEDDHARDLELRAPGFAVHRFSGRQLTNRAGGGRRRDLRRARPRLIEWAPMAADAPELFLIDGNSLAYRAFFALPESIGTSDGRPTNAIYGLASMLVKIIDEHHPQGVVVAWDAGMSRPRGHLRPLQGPAQTAPRPAARAVAAPDAAGRGLRLHQRQGRGLRGRRRDRLAGPAGARAGDRGDGRDRRPRRLPAGRRGGAGDEHLARDHRDQDLRPRRGATSATACRRS